MNDSIDRKVVAVKGDGPREVRRLTQAGAAAFAMRRRDGADRAQGRGQGRKIVRAWRAEQVPPAVGATKQATAWQGGVEDFPAKPFEPFGLG